MIYKNEGDDDNNDDYNPYQQDMMNRAAGYVISRYIYKIKKFKIDSIQPLPTHDDFYNLIKSLVLNDKEFHNYIFDNYKIHFRYNEEKDIFYLENYD
ncbi:MAG: hypothetical protein ACR2F1_08030 [Nitrososphaeraceae archaeon]